MISPGKAWRALQLGLKNLSLHKARSALTMLGIIFGVSSVIAMLAIGEGANYAALEAIKRLGSTNIILESKKPGQDEKTESQGNSFAIEYGLTYQDAYRFLESVPDVQAVLPIRRHPEDVQFGGRKAECTVIGTTPRYLSVMGDRLRAGRFLTAIDEERKANVCVISSSLSRYLFVYRNPLRESITVGGNVYRVVGIVADGDRPDADTIGGAPRQAWGYHVIIPLATDRVLKGEILARRTSGSFSAERVELHQITVQVSETERVEAAARSVQALLERYHEKRDFEMTVPIRLLREAERQERIFSIVLGSIAAISLLVGGIGIMNIMLATVTERTREIGIRRALGAKRADIVTQFLVETVVLSVGGGVLGIGLGLLIPQLVDRFTGMPTIVTPGSLALAFGVSVLVGVVFGLYPAKRAAELDPIEALRHE